MRLAWFTPRLVFVATRLLRYTLIVLATLVVVFLITYVVTLVVPGARELIDKRFIFFPERELQSDPSRWGLEYEEVHFPAADGVKLHGWYVPGNKDVTWIWFHGNAGNISDRLENLTLLNSRLGVNIFLFDYRGYGLSEGTISEEGTYRDAQGALDYVRSREGIDTGNILYFGRSLGSAVAVWLATQQQPYGLVLESPFASIRDMAQLVHPRLPLYLLVRTKYDSLSRIGRVSAPVLVIHGDKDETIPLSQAQKLYDAAQDPKQLYIIPGADHNNTYLVGGESYFRVLDDFMAGLGSAKD